MSTTSRPVHDVGLSDEQVTLILDKLDAMEARVKKSERRSDRRYLRGTAMLVNLSRPGYTMADFRVRLRNISRHGVAFLSGNAMQPGTRLRIQLPIGPDLSIVEQEAVVTRCRQVESQVHEIGAEFPS